MIMKNLKYILGSVFLLALVVTSCQDDEAEFGDIIAPTNVTATAEIVGVDANNPNGDGSGIVHFVASSDNAITYRFNFGDGSDVGVSPTGEITHQFSLTGLNTYSVTVMASGRGGITTTMTMNIDVFSSFEDDEAKNFLTGGPGNSKTWYWAADKPGNIGLGPNDFMSGGEHTFSQWFTSDAWHADKLCMYDAEFVFMQSVDGDVTFEQLTDIAYTPGDFAASIGVDADTCHGVDVAPNLEGVKRVTFSPSSSVATEDGNYRGTTINFSDGGFMSWYVNVSSIEIIEITDNSLFVRMTDASNAGFAWYCKYQTENPND